LSGIGGQEISVATLASRTNWTAINLDAPITDEATPPADLEMLALAEFFVRAVFTAPYCGAGLVFEGNTSGYYSRQISQIFAPATTRARYYFGRYGLGGAAQGPTQVAGEASGLGVYSVTDSAATGAEVFGGIDDTHGAGAVGWSGTEPEGTAGADAYFNVRELLEATPLAYCAVEVQRVTSICFDTPPEGQSGDLEVL
jgi:hypothetical protein